MDDLSPLTPEEKPSTTALLLSALVHLLLVGALFFGVQWKSQAPSSVAVEVWRSAPAPVAVVKPEPVPEPPPKPEPKPEPKPVPKVEPTPPAKPDIAIKEEKKKEEPKKPKKEEPKKEEPKKPEPKKEEPKKPEPKREEPDWKKELEREQKQIDQQKATAQTAQDQRAQAEAELRQLGQARADQAAQAQSRAINAYEAKVIAKIRGNIVLPPSIKGNPEGIYVITQLPTGDVIDVRTRKSSGNTALDSAFERAVRKSDPLPKPDQAGLYHRELVLKYKPFEE